MSCRRALIIEPISPLIGDIALHNSFAISTQVWLWFLFFIISVPVEAAVVLQEHLNRWYSLPTYCISKILADLPVQVKKQEIDVVIEFWYNNTVIFPRPPKFRSAHSIDLSFFSPTDPVRHIIRAAGLGADVTAHGAWAYGPDLGRLRAGHHLGANLRPGHRSRLWRQGIATFCGLPLSHTVKNADVILYFASGPSFVWEPRLK